MIIKLLWALLVLSFITIGVQSLNISDLKFRKSEQLRTFTGALNNARQEERNKCGKRLPMPLLLNIATPNNTM